MHKIGYIAMVAFLSACQQSSSNPPVVSIISPAIGQSTSNTIQVQISAISGAGISKITLYVRSKGSTSNGTAIGSSIASPYVISWYTPAFPNLANLELYADAQDTLGAHTKSDPVSVITNNIGAASLNYVAAYTLPTTSAGIINSASTFQESQDAFFNRVLPSRQFIQAPKGIAIQSKKSLTGKTNINIQDAIASQYALEWAWQPVSGATGYRIWQAQADLVGPYTNVYNQLATVGTQKFSRTVSDAKVGSTYYGLVTAVTNGTEGGDSNAGTATFLAAQTLSQPAQGAVVPDGRPNLSWPATPNASGYLWFVSSKPQATATPSDWLCTNSPTSTDALTVLYPTNCPTLKSGTYYWWVAGVSFNVQGQADAFTLSSDRMFTVQ